MTYAITVVLCALSAHLAGALQPRAGSLRGPGRGGGGDHHAPQDATPTGDAIEESCNAVSRFMVGEGSCVHNNLGGKGPDVGGEESLVFANVFPFNSEQVDLKVTVVDGQYTPFDVSHNGERGFFMSINVKCGTTAVLDVDLVDAKTGEPRPAPYEWMFSIFDFDEESNGVGRESVSIRGFDEVIRTNTSRVEEGIDGIFSRFSATRTGEIEDNPVAPWNMTTFQMDDTVTLLYSPRFELRMKLAATDCDTGRNFEFSGTTGLGCPWKAKCKDYSCPEQMVKRTHDGLFCKHETCGDVDIDTCCGTTTTTTTTTNPCHEENMLSFQNLKSSNLGDLGPDTNAEAAIIFENVFPKLHHKVDLAIIAQDDYEAANVSRNEVIGHMLGINVMMGTETRLKFEFRHTNTKHPVQVPPFFFTIADIDERLHGGGVETVKISKWESMKVSEDTTLIVDEDAKSFTSTEEGELDDNPEEDALELSEQQKQKAVSFKMPALYNFHVTLGAGEREPCTDCHDQHTGRNVMFAGGSNLVCHGGGHSE